jgi:aspartyl-tRNA(Asn)/glutamyl-tRNA(Gln) amidotransferase subunit A
VKLAEKLYQLSAMDASRALRAGECSLEELLSSYLGRHEEVEPVTRAFITHDAGRARQRVRQLLSCWGEMEDKVLAGLPAAIKDNLCTREAPTTCGSRMLEGFLPPYDATVVERLQAGGMVLMGKTNLDEFAMGSSTETSAYGATSNPWRRGRVPGGSSGGSAAAVAAGQAAYALGSDTGGSVRQPAAFCGLVGMKPTYGRVSRCGLVAYASSLDQVGTITRTVEDSALVLGAIAGYDPLDSTSVPAPVPDYRAALGRRLDGLRLGVPREYLALALEEGVRKRVEAAISDLERLGAEVGECSLPHSEYALSAYYVIASAEASSNLARYDGIRHGIRAREEELGAMYRETRRLGFGSEVKRRIMLGTYVLSAGYYDAYYLRAQKVRTLVKSDFSQALDRFDALVCPTTPTVAFGLGDRMDDPLTMYAVDVLTIPVNLAGLPAMSVPCGLWDGLPVGLQLIGRPFGEETLITVGHALEQCRPLDPKRQGPLYRSGGELGAV